MVADQGKLDAVRVQYRRGPVTLVLQLHFRPGDQLRADCGPRLQPGKLFRNQMPLCAMIKYDFHIKLTGNPQRRHDVIRPVRVGPQRHFMTQHAQHRIHAEIRRELFGAFLL